MRKLSWGGRNLVYKGIFSWPKSLQSFQSSGLGFMMMMHDLRRFSEKHAWRSELGHRLAELHWILDRMHAKTHTDPWCLAHCHPDVNEASMAGFNSTAAESCNSTIGRHMFAIRHMRPFVRSFFL